MNLHLGCGPVKLDNFVNIDLHGDSMADLVDDIRTLERFKEKYQPGVDCHVDLIYASHVLEHLSHDEVVPVLKLWFDILRPGGKIMISVPDLDRIVKQYMANWEHFQSPGAAPWIGLIYGGQSTPEDYHKTGFNFCWMKFLMEPIGWTDIKEYGHFPHAFGENVCDASTAKGFGGEYISLNVIATKPV